MKPHLGIGIQVVPTLSNRFTQAFGLTHPIVLAPMAYASSGALAVAVSRAGGLGLIGGGYGDRPWLEEQFSVARGTRVGVGFITWSLSKSPSLLSEALLHKPAAVILSFGDPRPFANEIHDAGAALICQCQNRRHVREAIEAGADVIVAQGAEAGGHGALRGTFSLVPEVADMLAQDAPQTYLLAAGGVADGRHLAAALMLGADGVLVGTRFWASSEAQVNKRHHESILAATGDDTIRTTVPDVVRQLPWPKEFTARIRRNAFTQRWHGNESELAENVAVEMPKFFQAYAEGNPEDSAVWFGEAAGLIDRIEPVGDIMARMSKQASSLLGGSHSA